MSEKKYVSLDKLTKYDTLIKTEIANGDSNSVNSANSYAKSYTDEQISNMVGSNSVATQITNHNTLDTAHNDIRELIKDLTTKLNNFLDVDDTTSDQLSEVLTLIENNKGTLESLTTSKINVSDIIDNLTTSTTNQVLSAKQGVAIKSLIDALQEDLDSHTHDIADVNGLQNALNGKAASSHGTHVTYSTTAPVMDGTASVGTASTVARSDHKHPTDTSRAAKTDLDSHTGNTTIHITSAERTKWNATLNDAKAYTDEIADGKSDVGHTHSYLPLSGGTLTGNLTGKYLTGTWLQTTASTELSSAPSKIAVLDGSGWVYYRSLNNLKTDLGVSDTKVTQTATTTDGEFPLLLRGTSAGTTTTTTTTTFGTKMTANPSTGELTTQGGLKTRFFTLGTFDDTGFLMPNVLMDSDAAGVLTVMNGTTGGECIIEGVAAPVEDTDAANKEYVDGYYSTSSTLQDNTYHMITGNTITKGSANKAWGYIVPSGAITCNGFYLMAGDNPANAKNGEFWEFNVDNGFIIFKNWQTTGDWTGGYIG